MIRQPVIPPGADLDFPASAARLMRHARAHGWAARSDWLTRTGSAGPARPALAVQLGRPGPQPGTYWLIRRTWMPEGVDGWRIDYGTAVTPDSPKLQRGPATGALLALITANPRPVTT